ncbi:hypothetical protein FRC03_003724 [Tulasnella sp. 419]|nr:hypothetical protein FRC03_003724 [Tulasnella sp. 419]
MRVRLVTHPPLPPLKAWFGITTPADSQSITALKNTIYTQVLRPNLSTEVAQSSDLLLEIEGFELLGDSTCENVLQDGDLVE